MGRPLKLSSVAHPHVGCRSPMIWTRYIVRTDRAGEVADGSASPTPAAGRDGALHITTGTIASAGGGRSVWNTYCVCTACSNGVVATCEGGSSSAGKPSCLIAHAFGVASDGGQWLPFPLAPRQACIAMNGANVLTGAGPSVRATYRAPDRRHRMGGALVLVVLGQSSGHDPHPTVRKAGSGALDRPGSAGWAFRRRPEYLAADTLTRMWRHGGAAARAQPPERCLQLVVRAQR